MHVHHLETGEDNSLGNLVTCCVACHAVNHFGNNLRLQTIELWSSPVSQVEIVRTTRDGVRAGKSLADINSGFDLTRGPIPMKGLMHFLEEERRRHPERINFALAEPVSVVFVNFKQWQI